MLTFGLFKALSISVSDDIKVIRFLESIKDNKSITISSEGKSMEFEGEKVQSLINGLIEERETELELLRKDMLEAGYIKEDIR